MFGQAVFFNNEMNRETQSIFLPAFVALSSRTAIEQKIHDFHLVDFNVRAHLGETEAAIQKKGEYEQAKD